MGQRLVITIHAFNDDIAKIYYHWSAYTESALSEAKDIIENVDWENCKTKDELILRIIRHIEENGGGIDGGIGSEEYNYVNQYFKSKYKFNTDPNRNYGLIAISEKCMNEIQMWSEGDLKIDFDEQIVHNDVFSFIGQKEDFIEFYSEIYSCNDEDINFLDNLDELCYESRYDLQEIDFCDLSYAISEIGKCPGYCEYKNTYYILIN